MVGGGGEAGGVEVVGGEVRMLRCSMKRRKGKRSVISLAFEAREGEKCLASNFSRMNSAVICFLSGVQHAYHTSGVSVAPVQAWTTVIEMMWKGTLMQLCREYACIVIMHITLS